MKERIYEAAHVHPSPRQLAWQELEFIGFFHFTVNTFTGREWGNGRESPAIFNPTNLDTRQWAQVARDAGMKLAILTTKHHDGFCLWPSQYTDHSVKNSPFRNGQGDVVGEFVAACREFGLKVGFYLSPWDRHEVRYGTNTYNDYFKNQLRELLTQYGAVDEIWFDGACGEGRNGKKQVYDWTGYYQIIRELQPQAVIAINGPDARWVGNERGIARENEWSVLPITEHNQEAIAARSQQQENKRPHLKETDLDLGSRKKILTPGPLVWYPAESDVSIRPGWFFHRWQNWLVKSPKKLVDLHFKSVGRNSVLLLNLPPDKRGLIHEKDVAALQQMRRILDETFSQNLLQGSQATASHEKEGHTADHTLNDQPHTYWTTEDWQETAVLEYSMPAAQTFNVIMLQEHITVGQRIERFTVEAFSGSSWRTIAQGGTVGYQRLLRCSPVSTQQIRISITASRFAPTVKRAGLFLSPGK